MGRVVSWCTQQKRDKEKVGYNMKSKYYAHYTFSLVELHKL